jgi:GalNAc-alpha-(1->4)-GalNAc-alpha-(1->3)-diNAcBac-PP-undecaprenol alpha-1,4-N-acetyl-D-galactosaminyltransferase
MNPKKILIIAPCLSMGGMERASANIANELSLLGHKVVYVSIFKKVPFFNLNPDVIFEEPTDGSNVHSLNILKTIKRIRKSILNNQPDTILAFNKFYAALTAFALIGIDVPFFISERSSPFFKWSAKIAFINRIAFFLKPPTGIMAQTKIAAQIQKKRYLKSKIQVIPNIVREVKLYPETSREPFILAVGRLNDTLKGFDRLLEAMAISKTNWPLYLAGGEANSDDKLNSIIKNNSLGERIHFLGKVLDMDSLYSRAGLFVIPSRSEGFPNALVEAMAAGMACVAYDFVAGPQDIIENNVNGILIPNGDIQALADAMDALILNADKRTQLEINALIVRETYKSEKIAKRISQFILSEKI